MHSILFFLVTCFFSSVAFAGNWVRVETQAQLDGYLKADTHYWILIEKKNEKDQFISDQEVLNTSVLGKGYSHQENALFIGCLTEMCHQQRLILKRSNEKQEAVYQWVGSTYHFKHGSFHSIAHRVSLSRQPDANFDVLLNTELGMVVVANRADPKVFTPDADIEQIGKRTESLLGWNGFQSEIKIMPITPVAVIPHFDYVKISEVKIERFKQISTEFDVQRQ